MLRLATLGLYRAGAVLYPPSTAIFGGDKAPPSNDPCRRETVVHAAFLLESKITNPKSPMFLRQFQNELLKLFARKRTYIGFGTFVCVQSLILLMLQLPHAKREFTRLLENNGLSFAECYYGLTLAVIIIMFTIFILGALYLALVAGDMVAKEVEEGTMRMILSRPVSRLRLVAIKWLACLTHNFALIIFIGVTSLIAGTLYRGGLGSLVVIAPQEHVFAFFPTGEGLWRFGRAILFLALALQAVTTMAFMFSCFNMKPAAATILTLSVLFVDFVLHGIPFFRSYSRYFISDHVSCWILTFHETVPWWTITESIFFLASLNISFWIIGAMRFCSRDFKA
jgi:ABC-2 type transport system permease protein